MRDHFKFYGFFWFLIFTIRVLVGAILIATILPVSVDEYFRLFYAQWWWNHIGFTNSNIWLPGYFYIYGMMVGVLGDTFIAPRVFTFILHLSLCAVFMFLPFKSKAGLYFAVIWIMFSPLSFVLGIVPLSETLYFLFVVLSIVLLIRFLKNGRSVLLLGASVCVIVSTAIRYEGWIFIPLFIYFAQSRKSIDIKRSIQWMLVFLPVLFPFVWTMYLWAIEGELFSYLNSIKDDHFGADNLLYALMSLMGFLVAIQCVVALVAVIKNLSIVKVKNKTCNAGFLGFEICNLQNYIWELYFTVAAMFIFYCVLTENVVSQYSIRMLYPLIIFSAVPVAKFLEFVIEKKHMKKSAAVVVAIFAAVLILMLMSAGFVAAHKTPLGIKQENYDTAMWIKDSFENGKIKKNEHVLISLYLPDCAGVFVMSNNLSNVHLDSMGDQCPAKMLETMDTICPLPNWVDDVQYVVARSQSREFLNMKKYLWTLEKDFGIWKIYKRPSGALFPIYKNVKSGEMLRVTQRKSIGRIYK